MVWVTENSNIGGLPSVHIVANGYLCFRLIEYVGGRHGDGLADVKRSIGLGDRVNVLESIVGVSNEQRLPGLQRHHVRIKSAVPLIESNSTPDLSGVRHR